MKKLGIILITLGVLVWCSSLFRPQYRAYKEKKFAAQANEALAKNDYRKAVLSARQVLVLNSNNLAACRIMAEVADLSRAPEAMVWRRRVVELEPTLTNRILFASCALRYEQPPFPMASQAVEDLASSAQNEVAFHLVAAQLALRLNNLPEGEKHFEDAIRLDPTNDLHRVNLAIMRLESRDTNVSAAAHTELERLQSGAAWGLQARRALVIHHLVRQEFTDAERFSAALLRDPNTAFSDKLEHLAILKGGKSAPFDGFLAALQQQATTNVLIAADLLTRLTDLGMASNGITWAKSLPKALRDEPPLPMALASSYFALGRWRELEESLNAQNWKERDFVRKALMAHAVRQQNETRVAEVHWKEALQLASARPELLGTLAQMASAWGWTNETEAVLWRAAKGFPDERWPIDSLQNGYMRTRNTHKLYELNSFALQRQPGNFFAQNNWATLSFLLGTNLTKAHQLARQVYDRDTNNFAFVSTYAYSLHLQGRTAEGLKAIEALKPAALEDPSVAGYYGVILAASGQKEKALRYFDKAEAVPLFPEELKLITDTRRKL